MEINVCPRWILVRLGVPAENLQHAAMLISTLLVLLLLPLLPHIPHFCLMKRLLGVACPGCGISHSLMAVFRMDLWGAWRANPAGIALAGVFLLQIVGRSLALAVPRAGNAVALASRHGSNFAVVLLLVVWISRIF